jgi:hypothetical protein
MANLWVYREQQWTTVPLDRDQIELPADQLVGAAPGAHATAAVLAHTAGDDESQWALIVGRGPRVRVNGDRVMLGIRSLRDRDAIQIDGGERIFFSTQSAPVVAAYGGKIAVPCPRCSSEIQPGDLSVQCPRCRAYFHHTGELQCWLYTDRCICDQPTALNDENCWRPDEY